MTDSIWFDFGVALMLGLLVGVERERSKGEGPGRRAAGVRTFALLALLGAIAVHLGGGTLLATIVVATATFAAVSYFLTSAEDPGLTTEVGMLITPLLGALAMSDAPLASGLGVAVAVVFAAKAPVHDFLKGSLSEAEFRDGLIFSIVTFVIWPQLPNRYMGPLHAVNPHTLWLLVVLVLAIGACGHILTRTLGARYGLPISGLASGFVSSTATIGAMAGYASRSPMDMRAAAAGATLSTVATFLQMAIILFAVTLPTLEAFAPMLVAGGLAAVLYGLGFALLALRSSESSETLGGHAFSIRTAAVLAATMTVMLIVAAGLKDRFDEAGIVIGAGLAGFIDTHSAAISIASLTAGGKITPNQAVLPVLVAMSSNAAAKAIMAIAAGSRGFAFRIVPGLVLSTAAAWAAAIVVGLG